MTRLSRLSRYAWGLAVAAWLAWAVSVVPLSPEHPLPLCVSRSPVFRVPPIPTLTVTRCAPIPPIGLGRVAIIALPLAHFALWVCCAGVPWRHRSLPPHLAQRLAALLPPAAAAALALPLLECSDSTGHALFAAAAWWAAAHAACGRSCRSCGHIFVFLAAVLVGCAWFHWATFTGWQRGFARLVLGELAAAALGIALARRMPLWQPRPLPWTGLLQCARWANLVLLLSRPGYSLSPSLQILLLAACTGSTALALRPRLS